MLCHLRPLESSDSKMTRDWRVSEDVSYYFPSSGEITLKMQSAWIKSRLVDNTCCYFIICEVKSSTPVGMIFLTSIDTNNKNAEFGYYLGESEYQGTGIAIEAEMLLLDYAFNELMMHKVYCESLDYNNKALSIHNNFGFVQEGIKREHIYKNDTWNHLVVMSVLEKEYYAHRTLIESIIKQFADR